MLLMLAVSGHVNRQKRELMEYLLERGACAPQHAITLAGVDVKPSILRSLLSRNVVKQTATGKYFLDPSRVQDAYGASNRFILGALGVTLLALLVIMLL